LAAGVVLYLIFHGDISWEPLRASMAEWQFSIPAFLLLALTPLGQLWRWQNLLRAGGVSLPNRDVFSFLMISKFFNMAFPGYVSGDILRGWYIFRRGRVQANGIPVAETERGKTAPPTVVASIVFDRAAGLFPLFVLSLAGLLGVFWHPLPAKIVLTVGLVAGGGVAAMLLLFLFAYWLPRPPELLLRLAKRIHCEASLKYLQEVTRDYVRDLPLIARIVGISFLTQGAGLASFVLFGWALKVDLPLAAYLIVVPLGLMLVAVPIAPAGLGVGQVAFLSLFHFMGTSQGANLFTLYMASFVFINLSGAFLYMGAPVPSLFGRSPAKLDKQTE